MIDITWYGQSCIRVKSKNSSVVFDPYDDKFTGLKTLKLEGNIVCITHQHEDHNNISAIKSAEDDQDLFEINGPGEYEKNGITIVGVDSYHDDKNGAERGKNTIYLATIEGVNIVHLGDLGQQKLNQNQIEELSMCDILFIPVGGVFTINAKDAPDIISSLEPKIVVPIHYKTKGLKFDLEQVDNFLKAMGKNPDPISKLSVSHEKLPEELEVVLMEMQ